MKEFLASLIIVCLIALIPIGIGLISHSAVEEDS